MAEYSRMARGSFLSSGAAQVVPLPFQPDHVKFINYTLSNTNATSQNVVGAEWDVAMGQGVAVQQGYNTTPSLIYDVVPSGGISTYYAGLSQQFGPVLSITGITKANPAVVTTSANHNLASGAVVVMQGLYQTSTTGMPQLQNIPFTVTVLSATTFSIPWNTNQSNYTALSSPLYATVKQVLYPYLYFPGDVFISAITAPGSMTPVLNTVVPTGAVGVTTTAAHNYRVGQEVAFRIPSQWGSVELNSLPDVMIPGSPIYGYVTSVTDYHEVIVQIGAAASFTAFNSNQSATSLGYSYPQLCLGGDVNSGGEPISLNSVLYPPPVYEPIGTTQFGTINGPAIRGSYVNNTSQGFIIGAGAGRVLTSSVLVGASTNLIIVGSFLA